MMGINNKSNAAPKTKQATLSAFFAKKPSPAPAPEAAKTNQAASSPSASSASTTVAAADCRPRRPIRRGRAGETHAASCLRQRLGGVVRTAGGKEAKDSGGHRRFSIRERRCGRNDNAAAGQRRARSLPEALQHQQPLGRRPGFDADMDEAGGEDDGEEAYLEIRKKNPGVVLAVEVGYKYRFFEEDATSIPVHRLNVHVSKLVQLGYKVGIVRQTETAALKAAGDNKSAPFERKLTNIFTKGTFIDPDLSIADSSENGFENKSSYIMCVAVQLSTGEVIYDSFQDCLTRTELETRLEHLNPVELILPFGEGTRVALTEFFERPLKSRSVSTSRDAHVFSQVLDLPGPIGHMVLSGPTLKALEIFETEEAGVIKGSLLWVLDHTITKFGARLLRKWVGRPLVNVALRKAEMTDARKQVLRLKLELKSCEAEFGEILKGIRKQIRNNALEYVSVSGMEYLVEIKVGNAGAVPKDWIKING
ncbi:hypothetical protein BDR26DRAFT_950947 [Obelidium mucronatum]|nr:hypothetical protein BDR26DRAFT_950947 [Obelidium mucronatum]